MTIAEGCLLAHCIPVRCVLCAFQTEFKQTPITAVTATATSAVQADIISTLGITRTVTVHQVRALRTMWPLQTYCGMATKGNGCYGHEKFAGKCLLY